MSERDDGGPDVEAADWPEEFRCPWCNEWTGVDDDYERIRCAFCGEIIAKPGVKFATSSASWAAERAALEKDRDDWKRLYMRARQAWAAERVALLAIREAARCLIAAGDREPDDITREWDYLSEALAEYDAFAALAEADQAAHDKAVADETRASWAAERSALMAAFDHAFIGGNHLANAMILRYGGDFPSRDTEPEAVQKRLGVEGYDLWTCWRCLMEARDVRDAALAADQTANEDAEAPPSAGRQMPPHSSDDTTDPGLDGRYRKLYEAAKGLFSEQATRNLRSAVWWEGGTPVAPNMRVRISPVAALRLFNVLDSPSAATGDGWRAATRDDCDTVRVEVQEP